MYLILCIFWSIRALLDFSSFYNMDNKNTTPFIFYCQIFVQSENLYSDSVHDNEIDILFLICCLLFKKKKRKCKWPLGLSKDVILQSSWCDLRLDFSWCPCFVEIKFKWWTSRLVVNKLFFVFLLMLPCSVASFC